MNRVSRHSRTALLALLTSGLLVGCQSTPVSNASVAAPASTIEASAEQTPELNIPESVLDGKDQSNSEALDDRAEIMVLALALMTQLESQVSRLDEVNIKLASDLEKREAVLKRLRELTLGQLED